MIPGFCRVLRSARPTCGRLTIRYPDGLSAQLLAGEPLTAHPDGQASTLTATDLHNTGALLVAYGLATKTGPNEVTTRLTRAEFLTALVERIIAGGRHK